MLAVNEPFSHDNEAPSPVDLAFPAVTALCAEIEAAGEEVGQALARSRRADLAQRNVVDIITMLRGGIDGVARDYEARIAQFATKPDADAAATLFGPDAAIYFMRELIVAKLPALVARLCPEAERGLAEADRREAISDAMRRADMVWEKLDGLNLRIGREALKLRDQRQVHYKHPKLRPAIEGQERRLQAAGETVKSLQAALRQRGASA